LLVVTVIGRLLEKLLMAVEMQSVLSSNWKLKSKRYLCYQ